jgi:hypothetical protein
MRQLKTEAEEPKREYGNETFRDTSFGIFKIWRAKIKTVSSCFAPWAV